MGAVMMRVRTELRASWRALVAIAVIAGLAAGASTAAAVGARRTVTAYPRFLRAQDAFHVFTGGGAEGRFERRFAALKRLPAIEDYVEIIVMGFETTLPSRRGRPERILTFFESVPVAEPTGRALYETHRAKIIAGRLPDRANAREVFIPFSLADRHDLRVGDTIVLGVGIDGHTRGPAERVEVDIVGIGATPGDFEAVGQLTLPTVYVTPALFEAHRRQIPRIPDMWSLSVHLRGGPSAAFDFKRQVERDLDFDVPFIEPVVTDGVQKTMRLYAAALWIVGALIALTALAVVGQTLARQIQVDAADYPTLRSLGMTPRELAVATLARAMIVGALAALIGIALSFLLSPLTPIGTARVAEPDPGFLFDAAATGIGAAATLLAVVALAVWPGVRAAREGWTHGLRNRGVRRPSRVVEAASRSTASPAALAGLRMALEPGHGRTAVPVRSTIFAVAIGAAAVAASLTIGRSLWHLLDHQELAGLTYDAIVFNESERSDAEVARALRRFPFVESMTEGTGLNINVAGIDSFLVAFTEGDPVGFAVISGRAPTNRTSDGLPEVAVGPTTMRRLGLRLGDEMTFTYPFHALGSEEDVATEQRAHVVGVAAIPPLPWAAVPPGEGAVMTTGAVRTFSEEEGGCCFVRFEPGADLVAARTQLSEAGFESVLRTTRADLTTIERITTLPMALSLLFALIAIATLAHVLVTGIHRRRRDLALLKTLGFVGAQVRGALAWQASTIAVLCILVGLPIGVVLGRWGWSAIALQFGVVPVPFTPVVEIAVAGIVALVLANLVAMFPGRSAARTHAAAVLRAE